MAYYISHTTCQQWHSQHLPFYYVVSISSIIKTFSQTNSCSWTTMLITCLRNIMPPFTFQLVYKMYQLQHPQSLIITLIGIVLRNIYGRNLLFWCLHLCLWGWNWSLMIWVFVSVHLWKRLLSLIPEGSNTCTLWCEAFLLCVCVYTCAVMYVFCITPINNFIVFILWQIRQDNDKDVSGSTSVSLWHVLESRAVDSAFIPPSTLSCTQQSLDS